MSDFIGTSATVRALVFRCFQGPVVADQMVISRLKIFCFNCHNDCKPTVNLGLVQPTKRLMDLTCKLTRQVSYRYVKATVAVCKLVRYKLCTHTLTIIITCLCEGNTLFNLLISMKDKNLMTLSLRLLL